MLWVLYGYSVAFGDDVVGGLVGNPFDYFGLQGLMSETVRLRGDRIPSLAFVGFQAVFAIITVALISGAIADRASFGPWMVFAGIWATLVYFPVAHWVFAFDDATGPGYAAAGSPTTSRRSTSPAVRRCTSTPVPRAWRSPWCSASGSAGSATRCARTT